MMRKLDTLKIILASSLLLGVIASCNSEKTTPGYTYMDDMYRSPAIKTYEPSIDNPRQTSSLTPVEGTISRGYIPYDIPNTNEGYEDSKSNTSVPVNFSTLDPQEGKELYGQFCSHCHGDKGDGNGILMQREKILGIPGYGRDRLPDITPGSIYHVIMHGKNNMGSHSSQLNYDERWKLIKYVLKLREDQSVMVAEATAAK